MGGASCTLIKKLWSFLFLNRKAYRNESNFGSISFNVGMRLKYPLESCFSSSSVYSLSHSKVKHLQSMYHFSYGHWSFLVLCMCWSALHYQKWNIWEKLLQKEGLFQDMIFEVHSPRFTWSLMRAVDDGICAEGRSYAR